jgi:Dyp-type peroxidase family
MSESNPKCSPILSAVVSEGRRFAALDSPLSTFQGSVPPDTPGEPVLDVDEIQGNSLVGFNKNHEVFLFLEITDVAVTKRWLKSLVPRIATVSETLAFRRLFRAMRARRNENAGLLSATWLNIAFTRTGIEKLTSRAVLDLFPSDAFKTGMADRAALLGDQVDAAGKPTGWVFGSANGQVDIMVIVASDSSGSLGEEIDRLICEIRDLQGISPRRSNKRGLRIVYQELCRTLPGDLDGHEHFGFKDGISQPGIRGRVSNDPSNFLTPRLIDPHDPLSRTHSRPGQPLIWPGQFVLGEKYPVQNAFDAVQPQPNSPPTPDWCKNGSFLVVRRLQQDVSAFWRFVNSQAAILEAKYPSLAPLSPERFAALMVGRWKSGVPIMREPLNDNPVMANTDLALNNFNFSNPGAPCSLVSTQPHFEDPFPPSPADKDGLRCPFAGHIRKVNPRDDTTELGGPERTLTKRILRRGIPFGPPIAVPTRADGQDRGLMFVAYVASIESQFEFLMTDWANSTTNPRSYRGSTADEPGGHDPIISESASQRTFTLHVDNETFERVTLPQQWVTSTGGGYFFSPSLTALKTVLSA